VPIGEPDERATVLYDDDCGFCKRLLSKFLAWDRGRRLRPVALQEPEADRLLGEMAPERKMASWHLVDADGAVRSGGAAVAPLLRLLPAGAAPAWIVERIPTATDRAADPHNGLRQSGTSIRQNRASSTVNDDDMRPDPVRRRFGVRRTVPGGAS